jgi:hypothetical protein
MIINDAPLNAVTINGNNPSSLFRLLDDVAALYSTTMFKDLTFRATETMKLLDGFMPVIVPTKNETYLLSDSLLRGALRGRVADNFMVQVDELIKVRRTLRQMDDSMPLSDSATAQRATFKNLLDGFKVSDASTIVRVLTRFGSDGIVLVDSYVASLLKAAIVRTLDDPLILFSQTYWKDWVATLSDGTKITDQRVMTVIRARLQSDGLPMVDSGAPTKMKAVLASEGIILTDARVSARLAVRIASEGIVQADAASALKLKAILASEGIVLTDALAPFRMVARFAADPIVPVDSVTAQAIRSAVTRVLDDALALFSASAFKHLDMHLDDKITLTDSFTKAGAAIVNTKSFDDLLLLTDGHGKVLRITRAQLEQLMLTDAFTKAGSTTRVLSDPFPMYDEAIQKKGAALLRDDAVPLWDSVLRYRLAGRVMGDGTSLLDVAAASLIQVQRLDEGLLLVDAFTKTMLGPRYKTFADAITMRDAGMLRNFTVTESTPTAMSDQMIANKIRAGALIKLSSESMLLVDSVMKFKAKVLIEVLKLDDTEGRYAELDFLADENVQMSEAGVGGGARYQKLLADSLRFLDSVAAGVGKLWVSLKDDALTISDNRQTYRFILRRVDEAAKLNDFTSSQGRKSVILLDELDIFDSLDGVRRSTWRFDDPTMLTDSVVRTALKNRQVSDALALFDQRALRRILQMADGLQIGDGTMRYSLRRWLLEEAIALKDDELAQYLRFVDIDVHVILGVDRGAELGVDYGARVAFDRFIDLALDDGSRMGVAKNTVELSLV